MKPIFPKAFPKTFFVTGTDTDVGKTVVAAMFTLGLGAAYWKPVQSGLEPMTDTERVRSLTQLPDSHFFPERFRLTQPLSPHAAATIDGVAIALSDFRMPNVAAFPDTKSSDAKPSDAKSSDAKSPGVTSPDVKPHLIIEGAGGLMVPLNNRDYMLDLIRYFQVPVCLVARSTLGTINHTLLSIEQLRRANIEILGVVMNGPKNEGNRAAIAHYGQVPILAEVEPMDTITPDRLKQAFDQCNRVT